MSNRSMSKSCTTSLRNLANGNLQLWNGLLSDCNRLNAEEAFRPSQASSDNSTMLAGELTAFRDYPSTSAAPYGITVWYVEDKILLIQINHPSLNRSLEELLGSPDGTAPSLLKAFHTQWIYAHRGLTAHVNNQTQEVLRLYAYPPTTVDEFLHSWISRIETRRIPLNH